jgi:autotransporter-associated beta strand protein
MMRQIHVKYGVGLLIACICLLTATTSSAVTYYWNPPSGGTGNWNTTDTLWGTVDTGSPTIVWSAGSTDTAVFDLYNGAGETVAVDTGGISAGALSFNVSGYTIAGPGILTLTTNSITVFGGKTATISANLAGSAGLQLTTTSGGSTVYNAGTLILSGDNSGLSGTIILTNSYLARTPTLVINSATALGTGSIQPATGASNTNSNGYSVIDCTKPGGVTLTTANTVNMNGNLYFGGTQNLNFGAGSVLSLDSTNEDTRVLGINGTANLQFGSLTNLRTNLRNLVLPGNGTGKLILGDVVISPSSAYNETLAIIGTHNVDITGTIMNSPSNGGGYGAFTWNDSGTLTLSGSNNFQGTTTLQAGTVVLDYLASDTNKITVGSGQYTPFAFSGSVNLQLKGGSTTQSVYTNLNAGGSLELSRTAAGTSHLAITTFNANNGGVMNLATGDLATTNSLNSAAGILAPTNNRASITVGGTDWAKSGTTGTNIYITAITSSDTGWYQTGTWANDNELITAGGTTSLSATSTVYTLKINNSASGNLDVGALNTLNLSYGGLLFTGSADYEIKNGTLKSLTTSPSDLIVITNGSGVLTISSIIANGNGVQVLTKSGTGTLIIPGLNTYTGATYVNEGTLQLGSSTTYGTSGPLGTGVGTLSVGCGATVDLNGKNLTVGALLGSFGTILNNKSSTTSMLTIGNATTNPNSNDGAAREIISNAGAGTVAVQKLGTGTWRINWENTYTGDTTLSGGTVLILMPAGQTRPFGSGTVHMNGSTITWQNNANSSASNVIANNFSIDSLTNNAISPEVNSIWTGTFIGSGTVQMRCSQSNGQTYDMQGNLTGFTGTFDINGQIANANSWFGLSNGTSGQIGVPNGSITMSSTTTGNTYLQWGGTLSTVTVPIGSLASAYSNAIVRNIGASYSTATFSVGGRNNASTTFAGQIINGTGTSQITALTKDIAGSGTFILSGTNTYTGATIVNNGTLEISGTGSLGATSITVNNGGTFKFDSGSTLNNSATATSITLNSGGSLQTAISLSNLSAVNVNAGGTLTVQPGSGTINITPSTSGAGVIVAGSNSTPGILSMVDGAIGTLNLSGGTALTIGASTASNPSVLNFEIGPTGTDKITIASGSYYKVDLGGATVNITGIPGYGRGTFALMTYDSGTNLGSGAFTLVGTPAGLFTFSLVTKSTELDLVVTGNKVPDDAWWRGNLNNNWTYNSGATTNWSSDVSGTPDTGQFPGGITMVHFTAASASYLSTTLGSNVGVRGLDFITASAVTIGGSAYTLSIDYDGIKIESGSGAHTINTGGVILASSTNNETWDNQSSNAFTVNAPIQGSSTALTLSGTGLFVLNGAGNYSGGTTISSESTVRIGSGSALGTGALTVMGTLNLNGQSLTVGSLSGSGTVTNNSPPATIILNVGSIYSYFTGLIKDGSGTVALVKSGTGTATLSTSNSYTGGTTLNNGILNIADANALGTTGSIKFTGGTLQYASGVTTDYASRIKSSTSPISIDTGGQEIPYAGAIDGSNTGGVIVLGGGTLTLSGSNSFAGDIYVTNGTLKLGSNSALGNAANNLTIASGMFLDLNGKTATLTGTVTLGAITTGIITNSDTSNSATFNADIMNFQGGATGGLTLNSPGNIAFKRIDQAMGNATGQLLIWDSPATLTLGTSLSTEHNRMLRLIVLQGTVLLNMPAPLLDGVANNLIAVDRGLTITDGTVKLTGSSNNQIQDTVVSFGTSGTPTLDLNSHSEQINALADGYSSDESNTAYVQNSAVGTTSTLTLYTSNVTAGNPFAGVIRDGGGILAVTKTGTATTQVLTGVNTYTGPTTISTGSLVLSGFGSISNSSTISIASGAILDVSGTSSTYSTGVGQTISGGGSIVGSYTHAQGTIVPGTANTADTLTFDNTSTSGTVTISGGAINFNVSSSTSSGNDLIVLNGGTGDLSTGAVKVNIDTGLGYVAEGTYTIISQPSGTFIAPTIGGSGWTATWDRRGTAPTLTTTATSVQVTVHAAGAGNNLKWSGSAGAAWDVVTSVNWYDTTTSSLDKFYRDDNVTFADTYVNSTAPLTTAVTLNTTVTPASVTFNNTTLNYTLSGTGGISGATSLVKTGTGTLTITLTNATNNSYTGGTVINGGILSLSDDNNVGADAGRLTINKSTGMPQAVLQATATFGFAQARPITIGSGGGAIQVASGQILTISSTSTDFEGPLAVQGDGALTVNLNGAPVVGSGASISIASTSTLNVGGNNLFSGMNVDNNGALNITSGSKTVGALTGDTGITTLSAGTSLTATSVAQNTLTIGAGATLTIAAIAGGPSAGASSLTAVPEPATWAMLMLAAMGLGIYWRRRR